MGQTEHSHETGRSSKENIIWYKKNTHTMKYSLILLAVIGTTFAEIIFEERFGSDDLEGWVQSTHKGADAGKFVVTAGKFYGDAEKDKGIQTSQDAKFYALSKEFKPFSNAEKPLVIQFTVKHEQNIDCGGGYAKIFDCSLDQTDMHGDSPYLIMFGPDICGPGTKKVHVIFNHKEKNHLITKEVRCKDDVFTHLYTLIVNPDATYEVLIDNESAQKGSTTPTTRANGKPGKLTTPNTKANGSTPKSRTPNITLMTPKVWANTTKFANWVSIYGRLNLVPFSTMF